MKRTFLAAIMVLVSLPLTGCGGGSSSAPPPPPPTIVTQILSDPAFDGDIAHDLSTASKFTVTQGNTQSVFAGIDFVNGVEYRAFLDFPLSGNGGVPGDAIIESAILDIFINSILLQTATDTIPIRIDLVSFPQPMRETDFSRTSQPALATMTIAPPISQADLSQHISIDVTSLMMEAQRLGLPDFQVRILEDNLIVGAPLGLIEINDTTGAFRGDLAPLLQVSYF
jgi:hypothetical protein